MERDSMVGGNDNLNLKNKLNVWFLNVENPNPKRREVIN